MASFFNTTLDRIGHLLSDRLRSQSSGYEPYTPSDFSTLCRTLRPGDVVLIEGNQRVSSAIKYLTQSTWSHAAFYVGDALPLTEDGAERPRLIEVNLGEGCVAVPLSKYETFNTRICRAAGLSDQDRQAVVAFMIDRLGLEYDLRNIFDLLRYFIPTPPVPVRWRRRMLAFGSGDPNKGHLLVTDCTGVSIDTISDFTNCPYWGWRRRLCPPRNLSHQASLTLYAAGF